MPVIARIAVALILLGIAGVCIFLGVAAREAPQDSWWAFWIIYSVAGLGSVLVAAWLLWPKRRRI